jgi:hypothetical protein
MADEPNSADWQDPGAFDFERLLDFGVKGSFRKCPTSLQSSWHVYASTDKSYGWCDAPRMHPFATGAHGIAPCYAFRLAYMEDK